MTTHLGKKCVAHPMLGVRCPTVNLIQRCEPCEVRCWAVMTVAFLKNPRAISGACDCCGLPGLSTHVFKTTALDCSDLDTVMCWTASSDICATGGFFTMHLAEHDWEPAYEDDGVYVWSWVKKMPLEALPFCGAPFSSDAFASGLPHTFPDPHGHRDDGTAGCTLPCPDWPVTITWGVGGGCGL